jgi:HK97 gp10 family phage protein
MITQGEGGARSFDGQSGKSLAEGFVTIQTAGIRELARELEAIATKLGASKALEDAVRKAADHIRTGYRAKVGNVTGNLSKSVRIKTKVYDGATVAIVGPWQSGSGGSREGAESGNHAWLVEFGTGRRKPGTRGRRTYLNVHQMINGRMKRAGSFNNEQFANMSRGYYYLMGSINEATRQARAGSGYPHDFGETGGKQHPITLHPGETYAPMPAKHAMERTIEEQKGAVYSTLKKAIENTIEGYMR